MIKNVSRISKQNSYKYSGISEKLVLFIVSVVLKNLKIFFSFFDFFTFRNVRIETLKKYYSKTFHISGTIYMLQNHL